MRKQQRIILTLFCFLLPGKTYGVVLGEQLSFENDRPPIRSATFISKELAWIVTNEGTLMITRDGGDHWETTPLAVVDGFRPVSFFNRAKGRMIGRKGDIWETIDGGREWSIIGKLTPHRESWFSTRQIQFLNESIGWSIELPGFVWQTADGGKSWREIYPFPKLTSESLVCLQFLDQNWGWVGGSEGLLLHTKDGGETWRQISKSLSPAVIERLCFVDKKHGWVIAGSKVFSTIDGGVKWKYHLLDPGAKLQPSARALFFLDNDNGWVVGIDTKNSPTTSKSIKDLNGIAWHTNSGGRSWEKVAVGKTSSLFSKVYFSDRLHGWITSRESVYRTTDGGKTWESKLRLPEYS